MWIHLWGKKIIIAKKTGLRYTKNFDIRSEALYIHKFFGHTFSQRMSPKPRRKFYQLIYFYDKVQKFCIRLTIKTCENLNVTICNTIEIPD